MNLSPTSHEELLLKNLPPVKYGNLIMHGYPFSLILKCDQSVLLKLELIQFQMSNNNGKNLSNDFIISPPIYAVGAHKNSIVSLLQVLITYCIAMEYLRNYPLIIQSTCFSL